MDSTTTIAVTPWLIQHDKQLQQRALAFDDLRKGFTHWRIWLLLAYQDIKLRYRRSFLGPFWLTLSMAITVYTMGFLYSHLFHIDLQIYFPFLVTGMLSWSLISNLISEMPDTFTTVDGFIKQIKLPYTLYIHRFITRHYIIFLHNIVVLIPILIIFHQHAKINLASLMLIPNLLLVYLNAFTYGLLIALMGARYRDISQLIKSLVQIAFFVTPVLWNPMSLPDKYHYLFYLNPFYIFVELIRTPMLGAMNDIKIYGFAFLITLIGIACFQMAFVRYRSRIIYWL